MKRIYIVSALVIFIVAAISVSLLSKGLTKNPLGEAIIETGLMHEPITILAFGDMMLDRQVRNQMAKHGYGYPFERIAPLLKGNDIVVVNAEGAFTDFPSVTADLLNKALKFTFDAKVLPTLKALGFTVLSQANNHTLDFGHEGYARSVAAIEHAGIGWFGDAMNDPAVPWTTEIGGRKIVFIGLHQYFNPDDLAVMEEIVRARTEGAFTVVFPHWGEEYQASTTDFQRTKGRQFIDAGADLVLGSHPHVIEPVEIYKGRAIFYSLGNFIFDQSFSRATSEGLAVHISLDGKEVSYDLIPFVIEKEQAAIMEEKRRGEILAELAAHSEVPESVRNGMLEGTFTLENPHEDQ